MLEAWGAVFSEPSTTDLAMSSVLLAKALGRGVEVAALTPYAKWKELLGTRETIGDAVLDVNGSAVATYELLAVQELQETSGPEIEIRILASDGYNQQTVYFYAKPTGPEAAA